jgi:tripartite ATP-independent transporter DctP family solute receptor
VNKSIRKILGIALICLTGLCGQSLAAEKTVLKFAGVNNTTHPCIRAINEKFTPVVKELSKGRIEVQVFDNSQLGGERDLMEQLQTGVLHMSYISPVLGAIDPAINVIDLPFLFNDETHVDEVLDSSIGLDLLQGLPSKGLIPLGYFENGFRVVTNSRRPINTLEDLKGLKIRTPEAPISVAIFSALGANVTPLSFAELYSALQQQVVDGQENAYNTVTSSRFFEVQKYVAETKHMWGCFVILASARWWNRLDQNLRDAIAEAAKQASRYQRDLFREQTAASKKMCLDAGMQDSTPDLTEFRKAVQVVYDDFLKSYPQYKPVVEQIRALRQ